MRKPLRPARVAVEQAPDSFEAMLTSVPFSMHWDAMRKRNHTCAAPSRSTRKMWILSRSWPSCIFTWGRPRRRMGNSRRRQNTTYTPSSWIRIMRRPSIGWPCCGLSSSTTMRRWSFFSGLSTLIRATQQPTVTWPRPLLLGQKRRGVAALRPSALPRPDFRKRACQPRGRAEGDGWEISSEGAVASYLLQNAERDDLVYVPGLANREVLIFYAGNHVRFCCILDETTSGPKERSR